MAGSPAPSPLSGAGGALHFLARQPRRRRADDALGQPLYLLRSGLVVVPTARLANAWDCMVIMTRHDAAGSVNRVTASDVEIETALSVMVLPTYDVDDTVDHITVWLTRVWQRWPGGNHPRLAQALVSAVDPLTLAVDLTPETVRRLLNQTHARPAGLRRLLEQMCDAGLLARPEEPADTPRPPGAWGRYALTMPA